MAAREDAGLRDEHTSPMAQDDDLTRSRTELADVPLPAAQDDLLAYLEAHHASSPRSAPRRHDHLYPAAVVAVVVTGFVIGDDGGNTADPLIA